MGKGLSFCDTLGKKLQNLWSAASEVLILRLLQHQEIKLLSIYLW